MNLEGIILGEISQTEKDKYCMFSLVCGILKNQNKTNKQTKQKQTHREQTDG